MVCSGCGEGEKDRQILASPVVFFNNSASVTPMQQEKTLNERRAGVSVHPSDFVFSMEPSPYLFTLFSEAQERAPKHGNKTHAYVTIFQEFAKWEQFPPPSAALKKKENAQKFWSLLLVPS
jgi:hypothetical protein